MRYLKLYESFNEIESICKRYGIENYTINPDGSIDVDNNVDLISKGLAELPLKFRKVTGYFHCMDNQLTSLVGAPQHVGGNFYCSDNKLISLEGAPQHVGGDFACSYNQLTSLEGSPKYVGVNFNCGCNQLTSLEGSPEKVGGNFVCSRNKLTSLEGAPKSVGGNFNCYRNKLTSLEGAPESVGSNFYCDKNQLTSLEHFPQVGGYVEVDRNPVNVIWQLFKDKEKIELFNDYDCIRGNEIIIDRLNEFLQEIGKQPVESVEGYKNI